MKAKSININENNRTTQSKTYVCKLYKIMHTERNCIIKIRMYGQQKRGENWCKENYKISHASVTKKFAFYRESHRCHHKIWGCNELVQLCSNAKLNLTIHLNDCFPEKRKEKIHSMCVHAMPTVLSSEVTLNNRVFVKVM